MVFPKVIVDRSAAMMRVWTTHLKIGSEYRKLVLSNAMACKDRTNCWSVAPLVCRDSLTMTLCPKQDKLDINVCLSHLMSNTKPSKQCQWEVSSQANTEVAQFDGGVLVSTTADKGEILVSQAGELVVHKNTEPSDHPYVLLANDGDYFHIAGQLYQLKQDTIKTGYDFKYNLTIPDTKDSLDGLITDGWIAEENIPQRKNVPWSPPDHYTW
jgi:hypothetical protein